MKRYEYQVVPAPKKGEKAKAAKTTADRFAVALTNIMNQMGMNGWDYIRADTLPCEERVGLTGTKSVFQNMLVFRREMIAEAVEMLTPQPPAAPVKTVPPLLREPKLTTIAAKLDTDADPSEFEPLKTVSNSQVALKTP